MNWAGWFTVERWCRFYLWFTRPRFVGRICVLRLVNVRVLPLYCYVNSVVSTSVIYCLERLVAKVTRDVSRWIICAHLLLVYL